MSLGTPLQDMPQQLCRLRHARYAWGSPAPAPLAKTSTLRQGSTSSTDVSDSPTLNHRVPAKPTGDHAGIACQMVERAPETWPPVWREVRLRLDHQKFRICVWSTVWTSCCCGNSASPATGAAGRHRNNVLPLHHGASSDGSIYVIRVLAVQHDGCLQV